MRVESQVEHRGRVFGTRAVIESLKDADVLALLETVVRGMSCVGK